jgi:SpoVK/Ycf46/Vps4 family AAA+-type ATPase
MLTKINDLRKAKRSIFVIATNYANRIDPAIKRIGRIDHKLLLLPPNLERRRAMIRKAWDQENAARKNRGEDAVDVPDDDVIKDAAKASCYLGWNDIESAVKTKFAQADFDMKKGFERADRATGPDFYGRRFPNEHPFDDQLYAETKWLFRLADERELGEFKDGFEKAAGVDSDPSALKSACENLFQKIKKDKT